jgi:hypothetical protein
MRRSSIGLLQLDWLWRDLPLLHHPIIFAQPLLDGGQAFAAAEQAPFPDQHRQLLPQAHQPKSGFGAVLVVVDLVADGRFHVQHLQARAADFPAQFVQSVVHGSLLELERHHKNKT